jgi:hypothetical protein
LPGCSIKVLPRDLPPSNCCYNRSAGLAGSGGKRQIWWNIAINRQACHHAPLSNPTPLEWLQKAAENGLLDWFLTADGAGGFLAHAKYKGYDDVVFGFYPSLEACEEARIHGGR